MRLDKFLVNTTAYNSRNQAVEAIKSGKVRVNDAVMRRGSYIVKPTDHITSSPLHPYVSRGGVKLAHALAHWSLDPVGKVCLDLGASTGGFCDVLLQHNVKRVFAVDVGKGQLSPTLVDNLRITNLEQTDARNLKVSMFDMPIDWLVCDISFVALAKILTPSLEILKNGGDVVGLFKPQFELTPQDIGKGGIVRPSADIDTARRNFALFLRSCGLTEPDWTQSPISGGDGNIEYLFHSVKH